MMTTLPPRASMLLTPCPYDANPIQPMPEVQTPKVDGLVAQGIDLRFQRILSKEAHKDQCCFYCEIKI